MRRLTRLGETVMRSFSLFIAGLACCVLACSGSDGNDVTDVNATEEVTPDGSIQEDLVSGDLAAEGVVGPEGGTLAAEGAIVEIPPGALTESVQLSIVKSEGHPLGMELVGAVYEFLPHGTTFALPVTVTVPFEPATQDPLQVRLFWGDEADGAWMPLPGEVYADSARVTGQTTHFSFGGPGKSSLQCSGEFTVNDDGDQPDASQVDSVCDTDLALDGNQCTLRAAIEQANACPGKDVVTFAISDPDTTIAPQTQLPGIVDELGLDGSSQEPYGTVTLDGTQAPPETHGLLVLGSDVLVRGLYIHDFPGDAIRASNSPDDVLYLESLLLSHNCGWGVNSVGSVHIGMTEFAAIPGQSSEILYNGDGEGCWGGGVLAWDGGASLANTEIRENNGPGVLAVQDVAIITSKITKNNGDGVYVETGAVRIDPEQDAWEDFVEISYNLGDGVYAAGACGDEDGCTGFESLHPLQIVGNLGWGIRAGGSVVVSYADTFLPLRSYVNYNGEGGDCFAFDPLAGMGPALRYDPANCMGGGILQGGEGNAWVFSTEVAYNGGPGILAWGNVRLGGVQAHDNGADGVRSQVGGVGIELVKLEGYEADFSYNAGNGIVATGTSDIEEDAAAGIAGEADMVVQGNGRWGLASRDSVHVGKMDGGSMLPGVTTISTNGADFNGCSRWTLDSDSLVPDPESVLCEGGGILVTDGSASVHNTHILDNAGAGVLAIDDVTLQWVEVSGNRGQGVSSETGCVHAVSGDAKTALFYDNKGIGIHATGPCEISPDGSVNLETPVVVGGNHSIGIDFQDSYLLMGMLSSGVTLPTGSSVTGNGVGDKCWHWSTLNEAAEAEYKVLDCETGAIVGHGEDSDVLATGLAVKYNIGAGIQTDGYVELTNSEVENNEGWGIVTKDSVKLAGCTVCNNTEGNIDSDAEPDATDTQVCGSEGDLCDSYAPCNNNLNCESNWAEGKAYCFQPGCISLSEKCFQVSAPGSDSCCFGYSCEQVYTNEALCQCLAAEQPCEEPQQCCSGFCEGGVCKEHTAGGDCVTDHGCEHPLNCEDGKCQDCGGVGDWCSDPCCSNLGCNEATARCCREEEKNCFEDKDCCSEKCVLYQCQ